MKEILDFVRTLAQNNNKEWFDRNKAWYREVLGRWQAFCEELICEVGRFDADIARLTLKDCTYRIYRDTRFSKDKAPYKTHFGVFLAPGGKRSMHAGYYFHLGTGEDTAYPYGHMLASGNYCYDPEAMKRLREDISDEWEVFEKEVLQKADPMFKIDMEGALKRVPKEFSPQAPYADFMRVKNYCLVANVDTSFVTSPHLAQRLAQIFRSTKPFNDYVNRAVDYSPGRDY